MLVFSIVSLSPPPSACLSYLPSFSVIFILFLSLFYPLPPFLLFFVFFSSCFSFSSPLLPFLVTSLFLLFSFFLSPHFFPFFSHCLLLFLLFSFLSDLPPSLFSSLPPTSSSLLFIYLHLLTRYEQGRELLEMKKVFLLEIIASACLPPPTPEQAASSMKTVSYGRCAKGGRNKLTDKEPKISTSDFSQIKTLNYHKATQTPGQGNWTARSVSTYLPWPNSYGSLLYPCSTVDCAALSLSC